jgi:F0F1-type ATP synthase membrane subunit b/b'
VLRQTLRRLESELAFKVHALAEAERESAQVKRELEQQRQRALEEARHSATATAVQVCTTISNLARLVLLLFQIAISHIALAQ